MLPGLPAGNAMHRQPRRRFLTRRSFPKQFFHAGTEIKVKCSVRSISSGLIIRLFHTTSSMFIQDIVEGVFKDCSLPMWNLVEKKGLYIGSTKTLYMMISIGLRVSEFGDIRYHRPKKGKRPNKVVLIAPHTNEHPAVLPFQAALAKRLMADGIVTEEKAVTDMMERAWEIRKRLGKTYPQTDDIIAAVLMLEDYLIRARLISGAIKKGDQGTIVLEMHGQTRIFEDEDFFDNTDKWRRLRGTKIIVASSATSYHLGFLDMEDNPHHKTVNERSELASEIASVRNLDLIALLEELEALGRELNGHKKRLKLVELPTKSATLPKEHPAYSYYYGLDGIGIVTSAFEYMYCTVTRESVGFSERDVEKVASFLII